jgi:peptidoglycan/LPS O-acetylase OafA/YrhL
MNKQGWLAAALLIVGILFLAAAVAVYPSNKQIGVGLAFVGIVLAGLGIVIFLVLILSGQDPLLKKLFQLEAKLK